MARVQTVYIEEGNAVRKLNPEIEYEEYLERRRQEEERRQRDIRRAKIHRQKRKKVASVYATMAIVFCVCFFVGYIYLQTQVTERTDNIAKLETQISTLKADNGAAEARINTAANLSNVRNTALNELGMVYANADQIVYYDMETTDHMNQYSKIP
jgi:cell division protein FtsL